MQLKDMIIELCSICAPSGFEDRAFGRISELLSPYVDEISSDALGNLIAVKKCGKPKAKKLVLDAHMDEIGLIVTGHEKGFLRFSSLGGVDPRMLPAREVMVLTAPPLYGVIDTMPPHALSSEDMDKSISADKLFIDIGYSQAEAEKLVPLGTPVSFKNEYMLLGDNMLCGKSQDDRACVAIITKVMENLKDEKLDLDVYCLFSTQEELHMRGAQTGAYSIEPDYAIAIDVTHAATPDSKKGETLDMRKGAAIGVGPNMTRSITNALIDTAKAKSLPYQIEVISGCSGTNGWVIQVSRNGVATAVVSLPIKYMHSPVETMDVTDAEAIVSLVSEFIKNFEEAAI